MPTHAPPAVSGQDKSHCQMIHPISWDSPHFRLCEQADCMHCRKRITPGSLRQNNWTMVLAFASLRVASKDKVGRFGLLVAGEAALHKRRITRFAICAEMPKPPAAGCGVPG